LSSREELHSRIDLSSIGRDLTSLAREGRLSPLRGRTHLVKEAAICLAAGHHILLVGLPGAGKTALVEALAQLAIAEETPNNGILAEHRIIECCVTAFQVDCLYVNEFETRVHHIVQLCRSAHAILFLDHLEQAVTAGACDGKEDRTLANLLLPHMDDPRLRLIGATTPEGHRAALRRNAEFVDRFRVIEIPPMTVEETLALQDTLSKRLRRKYGTGLGSDALQEAIGLGDRFYPWRALPGKAIDLIREAAAANSRLDLVGPESREGSPDDAAEITAKQTSLNLFDSETPAKSPNHAAEINAVQVRDLLRQRSGLPDWIFDQWRPVGRNDLIQAMERELFGHSEAVATVVDTLLAFKTDLNNRHRPIATFLLAGPTGVGKTELAKTTARLIYGSDDRLLRLDMAEYGSRDTLRTLLGDRGLSGRRSLVSEVIAHPFSVILLDEIEKAHPDLQGLLLSMLGEARLTDDSGRTGNFSNTVVFLTTNVGAELFRRAELGFHRDGAGPTVTKHELRARLDRAFLPEFLNRLSGVLLFAPLSSDTIRRLAIRELKALTQRPGFRSRALTLEPDDAALAVLVAHGYSPQYGGRQIQRAIDELVLRPLSRALSEGRITKGDRLKLTAEAGCLLIKPDGYHGSNDDEAETPLNVGDQSSQQDAVIA